MNLTMPQSDKEMNIGAIKRAIDNKNREVEQARQKLTELIAELRGLTAALTAIGGEPS
jgi:hypothetical protein